MKVTPGLDEVMGDSPSPTTSPQPAVKRAADADASPAKKAKLVHLKWASKILFRSYDGIIKLSGYTLECTVRLVLQVFFGRGGSPSARNCECYDDHIRIHLVSTGGKTT